MNLQYIDFRRSINRLGELVFIEGFHDIPFEIKRIYYIYGVPRDGRRGFHSHKNLRQVLVSIHGSCKILLDNGLEKETVELNSPERGLLLTENIWREMYDFSSDAVLLALASEHYDESDYIRDYDEFLKSLQEMESERGKINESAICRF